MNYPSISKFNFRVMLRYARGMYSYINMNSEEHKK